MANGMQRRLAVLIDADNASTKSNDRLFEEIAKLGTATVRRAYGDFSKGQAKSWESALITHAIVPQQQFANVPGKNATDFALVIDAMDLLHAGGLDAFCIVSSDSDFTRLATRIREHGLEVFGFGRADTAESFRRACQEFVEIDAPVKEAAVKGVTPVAKAAKTPVPSSKTTAAKASVADAERLLLRVLGELGAGGSWVAIETIHHRALKLDPSFKAATYGSKKLRDLIARVDCLECKDEGTSAKVRMKVTGARAATATVGPALRPPAGEGALAIS
ncbi:NYN domain-containing protein [Devosia sp. Root413D1]|uniref:NYN domain-containing protein n=1 Tax=Devosia sp. Root413D1 TaxID=1736531 RepID=UPI0009E91353